MKSFWYFDCEHETYTQKLDKGKVFLFKEICKKCGKVIKTWLEGKDGNS